MFVPVLNGRHPPSACRLVAIVIQREKPDYHSLLSPDQDSHSSHKPLRPDSTRPRQLNQN